MAANLVLLSAQTSYGFQYRSGGNNDNGQVYVSGDGADVFKYRQPHYLSTARVNRIYLTFISAGDQVAHHGMAQLARFWRKPPLPPQIPVQKAALYLA